VQRIAFFNASLKLLLDAFAKSMSLVGCKHPMSQYLLFQTAVYFFNKVSSSAAIASPTSAVFDLPPMSPVRIPLSMVILVASSIFSASSGRQREYLNIMLMERMVAMGLTMPCPAISGAEPVHD
jgi:hypothetical protein